MRLQGFLSISVFLSLAAFVGCNRGAHPLQTEKPAPDFTVSDGSSTVRLASYRGKPVLLNFWSSTCGPCIEELPSLLRLHHDQPDLTILAISADEDPEAYARFLARYHVDLITVRDPSQKAADLYHSEMWPESYAIDRNGMIQRKFVGAQDWGSSEIRRFLKGL